MRRWSEGLGDGTGVGVVGWAGGVMHGGDDNRDVDFGFRSSVGYVIDNCVDANLADSSLEV